MDLDEGKDKFYININIQHNPTYGFSSLASVHYKFFKPLIDKGGNYQVCVTDMQVDTKKIPLFIAEFAPIQNTSSILANDNKTLKVDDSVLILNYWIQVSENYNEGTKVYLKKQVKTNIAHYQMDGENKYVYNNDNENAYIYSHQEFIDMVNEALGKSMLTAYKDKYCCGFVIRNGKLVFAVQDYNLYKRLLGAENYPIKIKFSHSLYQYLGIGFPVKNNNLEYWEHDFTISGRES